ncbi:GNAT family N-acetyltransferase [Paenibacillus motobuensis]|uniref:GNAT family N-acetyltransferase n=1 Tax=Paenibacillus TaxID=44249 RepID=UPI00203DDC5D|nr:MULTISPECIES: GNAT family N-acetyltransferase [Paenibacillus]MCM3038706.1 GNAT family N-acetyltransferase [Paenibacillus lutimineralis]MCM3645810.1 GNAT family N-acetyltransferase [Paenibacillus motobuensis]
MDYNIIGIRENPGYAEQAIQYFSERWGIDERIYRDCIINSLATPNKLPRFYLMIEASRVIGGYGLITNDFVSRQDLFPYLCALYIEEDMRGSELGSVLLEHGKNETRKLGFDKLYLCTDHKGYYEKYNWKRIGEGYHPWNHTSQIYETDVIK